MNNPTLQPIAIWLTESSSGDRLRVSKSLSNVDSPAATTASVIYDVLTRLVSQARRPWARAGSGCLPMRPVWRVRSCRRGSAVASQDRPLLRQRRGKLGFGGGAAGPLPGGRPRSDRRRHRADRPRRRASGRRGRGHSGQPPRVRQRSLRGSGGGYPRPEVFVKQKHIWLPGNPARNGAATEPPQQAP